MKKLFIILFLLPVFAMAQIETGINFRADKKWDEVLALAKAENKLVFVDVYTDWCGPCKDMDEEVFVLPEVGDLYNTYFINYKLDAEKGEGLALARLYKVNAYPTFLFVNGNGELVYRVVGSKAPADFMLEGKNAFAESKQTQSIIELEALYPTKKKDKTFMYNYLSRLTKLKAPTADLLDEYVGLLNDQERSDPNVIKLIVENGVFNNSWLRLGPAMDILRANPGVFEELKSEKLIKQTSIRSIEENAMENSMEIAIREKDTTLFKGVSELAADFSEDKFENKQTLALNYYLETKDYQKYKIAAKDFVNNYLLKIPADSLLKWDRDTYNEVKATLEKRNDPKLNTDDELFSYLHTQNIEFTRLLCNTSKGLLKVGTTADDFLQAKKWALKAVQIAETDKKYYQNVYATYKKTYLIALYKSGEKATAIKALEKVIAELPDSVQARKKEKLAVLLRQMKTNGQFDL